MNELEIGDTAYVVEFRSNDEQEPCPVCFTKKRVTLILGDGTEVSVACQFCARGYHDPTGYIKTGTYETAASVRTKTITGIDERHDGDKHRLTYWFGGAGYDAERVGATEEEAIEKGVVEVVRLNAQKRRTIEERKKNQHKSYSWNAGYFMREADRALRDRERYLKKAQAMKSKARPRKG